jgi:hypothetical protein
MDHDNQLEKRNGLKYENARKRFGRQGVKVYIYMTRCSYATRPNDKEDLGGCNKVVGIF